MIEYSTIFRLLAGIATCACLFRDPREINNIILHTNYFVLLETYIYLERLYYNNPMHK